MVDPSVLKVWILALPYISSTSFLGILKLKKVVFYTSIYGLYLFSRIRRKTVATIRLSRETMIQEKKSTLKQLYV